MKRTVNIQAIEVIKVLGDARRVEILRLLMAGPSTLSQLGRALDLHPANIRYHIKQLERVGLVEFVFSREVRGFVEKYYQATAHAYFVNYIVIPKLGERDTIFALGSHDLALELLSMQLSGDLTKPSLIALPVGSLNGLIALRQGFCQFSGCHLIDPDGDEYNTSFVRHLFPGESMNVVTLAHREQGLLIPAGNPDQIRGVEDLGREDLRYINRKSGSGTRLWLDRQLQAIGLGRDHIRGYDQEASTHSEVAETILQGKADYGLGVIAIAQRFNLDFIPLFKERFDLVFPEEYCGDPKFLSILETIQDFNFRRAVSTLDGYDTTHTGEKLSV